MKRYRALQILLIVLGLACAAGLYPLIGALRAGAASTINRQDQMILSIYVTLGFFLLAAARDPRRHRSLVLFAACSTLAHVGVMMLQGIQHRDLQGDLVPFAIMALVGAALVVLSAGVRAVPPAPPSSEELLVART